MEWDCRGRLTEFYGTTCKYDENGLRTEKDDNGTITEYYYSGTKLVSQKTGSDVMNFYYGADGRLSAMTYNGSTYYYILNLFGDVVGLYDENGTVVVYYYYDAWGNITDDGGSMILTLGIDNPFRYRGYYYDEEFMLYYLQSRYYDPCSCRFISSDAYLVSSGHINGTNMFAYCLNNPIMYVDPSGCSPRLEPGAQEAAALICVCFLSSYFAEMGATADSFSDYLGRINAEDNAIFWMLDCMKLSAKILSGSSMIFNSIEAKSLYDDIAKIASLQLGEMIPVAGPAVSVGIDLIKDWLNPTMTNLDVFANIGKNMFIEMGGAVIAYSGAEIAIAVASVANPAVGAIAGLAWLIAGNAVWKDFTADM